MQARWASATPRQRWRRRHWVTLASLRPHLPTASQTDRRQIGSKRAAAQRAPSLPREARRRLRGQTSLTAAGCEPRADERCQLLSRRQRERPTLLQPPRSPQLPMTRLTRAARGRPSPLRRSRSRGRGLRRGRRRRRTQGRTGAGATRRRACARAAAREWRGGRCARRRGRRRPRGRRRGGRWGSGCRQHEPARCVPAKAAAGRRVHSHLCSTIEWR